MADELQCERRAQFSKMQVRPSDEKAGRSSSAGRWRLKGCQKWGSARVGMAPPGQEAKPTKQSQLARAELNQSKLS